jgi:DNA-binding NarL/FixJ family response regulator
MKKYRIIIVENDEDEQFFIRKAINAGDEFELVAQIGNGEELTEWLEANSTILPDVILSDLNMPGKNGHDILVELKRSETFSSIPVVITSTSSTNAIISKCIEEGAAAYLVKPDTFIDYRPFFKDLHAIVTKLSQAEEAK